MCRRVVLLIGSTLILIDFNDILYNILLPVLLVLLVLLNANSYLRIFDPVDKTELSTINWSISRAFNIKKYVDIFNFL